jgi:hypothetical protein
LQAHADGSPRWTIHDYGLATYYFGIRIVQTADAITMDQRPFSYSVLTDLFGSQWTTQSTTPGKHTIPLPAGTAFEARLAGETPASPKELATLEHKFGFKFRTLLGKFMQLSSWTRVDLVTATTRVSQYQSAPGPAHFEALHCMALYLRGTHDRGLTFTRKGALLLLPVHADAPPPSSSSISALHFSLSVAVTDGLGDPVILGHEPVDIAATYDYTASADDILVPRVSSTHASPCPSRPPITVLTPPPTEGEMDANHGSVFETVGFTGVVLLALGTVFYYLSQKQATSAYNTAESELYAATSAGKFVKWLRVWMSDIGLPYTAPIPMGEDNEATRIIGHAGKLTRNVRHLAIQTNELQSIIGMGHMALRRVGSADNKADHCTKMLPDRAFHSHTSALMGERFITPLHLAELMRRNGSM